MAGRWQGWRQVEVKAKLKYQVYHREILLCPSPSPYHALLPLSFPFCSPCLLHSSLSLSPSLLYLPSLFLLSLIPLHAVTSLHPMLLFSSPSYSFSLLQFFPSFYSTFLPCLTPLTQCPYLLSCPPLPPKLFSLSPLTFPSFLPSPASFLLSYYPLLFLLFLPFSCFLDLFTFSSSLPSPLTYFPYNPFYFHS